MTICYSLITATLMSLTSRRQRKLFICRGVPLCGYFWLFKCRKRSNAAGLSAVGVKLLWAWYLCCNAPFFRQLPIASLLHSLLRVVFNAFRALLDPAIVGSFACLKFGMQCLYAILCYAMYMCLYVCAWLRVCVFLQLRACGTIKSHDRIIIRFMLYNFLHEKPVE